jgi:PAS domain-containing protein
MLCVCVPLAVVASVGIIKGLRELFVLTPLLGITSCIGGWILLQLWEKKMQRSVSQLVQARLDRLQDVPDDLSESQVEMYQREIHHLNEELEKMRIGYEHQISLMQSSVIKAKEEVQQLHGEMDKKLEQMRQAYLEFEDLRQEYRRQEEEAKLLQTEGQKALENRESLIGEYQKTVAEQRMIIEKKQRYIGNLEAKVRDQMYEIRSLLQLETSIQPGPVGDEGLVMQTPEAYVEMGTPQTPYDFSIQLHRYIEKAEHLTGVEHLGYLGGKSPRFLDLSLDGYAVDKRRLFDSFKDETGGAVFIYSLGEKKFLFINPAIKGLTGWSQEKFIKEFPRLVVRGYPEWEEAIGKIKVVKECVLRLSVLNRSNQPRPIDCYMGLIAKGPFTHHAIGILIT